MKKRSNRTPPALARHCPACASPYHGKTLFLKGDYYECGCGYAVTVVSYLNR
jgi:hypothetical protein